MKNKIVIIFVLILLAFCIFSYAIFLFLEMNKENLIYNENNNLDLDSNFKTLLENEYPEFKDFENQESFAGKKVKFEIIDGDRYYAYMTLGSGLPIVEASCFRVDRMGRVFKIGVFPDPLDSYAGYRNIDPKNCKGIK